MYNLMYYQVVLQLCSRLTDLECDEIVEKHSGSRVITDNGVPNLGAAMALVLNNLDKCKNFRDDSDDDTMMEEDLSEFGGESSTASAMKEERAKMLIEETLPVDLKALELELQSLCLPFLRVASLLRHHIYHQELPEVKTPDLEFARLVYFLELVTKSMDWDKFNGAKALCFVKGTEISLPVHWCEQLKEVKPPHDTTRELIASQHVNWQQPRLLGLPREYERLFTVSLL